jgi:small subunit ribosomal protein S6
MNYELTVIIPLLTETETQDFLEKIKNLIQNSEGKIIDCRLLSKGRLAYPIKKVNQGQHYVFEFNIEKEKIKELEKNLKLLSGLLRFIIIRRRGKKEIISEKSKSTTSPLRGWTVKQEEKGGETQAETQKEPSPAKPTLEELDKKLSEILKDEV